MFYSRVRCSPLPARIWSSRRTASRDYAVYVAAVIATLLIATMLENELLPGLTPALVYAAFPQLLLLDDPFVDCLSPEVIALRRFGHGIGDCRRHRGAAAHVARIAHAVAFAVFACLIGFLLGRRSRRSALTGVVDLYSV